MKTSVKRSIALVALLATTGSTIAGNITVKGSDTLVILAQKWAEVYMTKNPGTKIQVTGGGSGIGIAALQNNTTDIANSSPADQGGRARGLHQEFRQEPPGIQGGPGWALNLRK
jgi:phosphate transport system substrate-binding protein